MTVHVADGHGWSCSLHSGRYSAEKEFVTPFYSGQRSRMFMYNTSMLLFILAPSSLSARLAKS